MSYNFQIYFLAFSFADYLVIIFPEATLLFCATFLFIVEDLPRFPLFVFESFFAD